MRIRTAAVALAAIGLAMVLSPQVPPATATVRVDPLSDAVTAPLLADCSSITENGRGYARLHAIGLCGADAAPASQPLRTELVGGEECGSATLSMTSRGGGLAAFDWRVSSSTGPIIAVELDLAFASHAGGEMRHFSDDSPRVHAHDGAIAFLGAGRATATISGTVQTFTATCRVVPVSVRIHVR